MAAPKLRLLYFDIHGKAARIRTAALYGGVALEDYRFASRDEFTALKTSGALPFGQVPLLEVNGGEAKIAQSAAILRYVCGLAGLHPSDPLQAAAVDAALDQEADAFASYAAAKYRDRSGFAAVDDATMQKVEAAINTEVLPRHLGLLERMLAQSTTGWIANTPTPAACDFAWATQLRELRLGQMAFVDSALFAADKLPLCNALVDRFLALPAVKAYYG